MYLPLEVFVQQQCDAAALPVRQPVDVPQQGDITDILLTHHCDSGVAVPRGQGTNAQLIFVHDSLSLCRHPYLEGDGRGILTKDPRGP